jgi:UDP-2,4-diacetamido-2,4,6-trideoxy-beta-L-altropyranose hydrolase
MRCLALAQAWQDQGGKATFISKCESDAIRQRLVNEGMDFISIENVHPDPNDLERTMGVLHEISNQKSKNATWLVIDGYHFDADYQKSIKKGGNNILWIDDYGHADHYYADLILNQNISADESLYPHREPYTQLLLGTRYALLRREFKQWQGWQREIPSVAKKVLVTLGGADPNNMTLKVIQALLLVREPRLEAKIVVGPANSNLASLEQEILDHKRLKLIKNAPKMAELMAWADLAVTAGGSTCWEMALLGLPAIIIIIAKNQSPIAEKLREAGSALNLGWSYELSIEDIKQNIEHILFSEKLRREYSTRSKYLVDGSGAQRAVKSLGD